MGINVEAYNNGRSFGLANIRTYGLRETVKVWEAAMQCEATKRNRFDWLCGLTEAVDEAKRKAQWEAFNAEEYRVTK